MQCRNSNCPPERRENTRFSFHCYSDPELPGVAVRASGRGALLAQDAEQPESSRDQIQQPEQTFSGRTIIIQSHHARMNSIVPDDANGVEAR